MKDKYSRTNQQRNNSENSDGPEKSIPVDTIAIFALNSKDISFAISCQRQLLDDFIKCNQRYITYNRVYKEIVAGEQLLINFGELFSQLTALSILFADFDFKLYSNEYVKNCYKAQKYVKDSIVSFDARLFFNVLNDFMFDMPKLQSRNARKLWKQLYEIADALRPIHKLVGNIETDRHAPIADAVFNKKLFELIVSIRNLYISCLNILSEFCHEKIISLFPTNIDKLINQKHYQNSKAIADNSCAANVSNTDIDTVVTNDEKTLYSDSITNEQTEVANENPQEIILQELKNAERIRVYLSSNHGIDINEEQALAIGKTAQNVLVTARAGSGKTRTIACKAIYAIERENIKPEELFVLTFNKNAASEVQDRIIRQFGYGKFIDKCARTFHSLAHGIVRPRKKILFDDIVNKQLSYTQLIANIINPELYKDEKISTLDNVSDYVKEITNFISFAKNIRIKPNDIEAFLGSEKAKTLDANSLSL